MDSFKVPNILAQFQAVLKEFRWEKKAIAAGLLSCAFQPAQVFFSFFLTSPLTPWVFSTLPIVMSMTSADRRYAEGLPAYFAAANCFMIPTLDSRDFTVSVGMAPFLSQSSVFAWSTFTGASFLSGS
jgi:hypothetical protein